MKENEHWSKLNLDPNRKRSCFTKEMFPEKFMKKKNLKRYREHYYNCPDLFYDCYSCIHCDHYNKCPEDIRAYHNLEASMNHAIGQMKCGFTGPAWCMGTLGYNGFEINHDKILEEE